MLLVWAQRRQHPDHRHVTSLLQRLRVERNGVTLTPP